jgi:stage III sporulation protein AD
MEVIKILGLAVVAVVLCVILRQHKPEYAMFISIVATIFLMIFSLGLIDQMINSISTILKISNINEQYFNILLKVIAVSYLTQFTVDICKDAQETAIASKVELAGKITILIMALPIYLGVFKVIDGILK